jgi:hypothetical protein
MALVSETHSALRPLLDLAILSGNKNTLLEACHCASLCVARIAGHVLLTLNMAMHSLIFWVSGFVHLVMP